MNSLQYIITILFLLIFFHPVFQSYGQMLDWMLLLEYIKALAWPIIVAIFLFYNRKKVSDFIDRIRQVRGPGGFEANTERIVEQTTEAATTRVEETQLTQLNERASTAERNALELQQQLHFERTYRLIFNSQLIILRTINNNPEHKLSADVVRAIYERTIWNPSYPFEEYINFLISSYLLSFREGFYSIEMLGILFLNYLGTQGIPDKGSDINFR